MHAYVQIYIYIENANIFINIYCMNAIYFYSILVYIFLK